MQNGRSKGKEELEKLYGNIKDKLAKTIPLGEDPHAMSARLLDHQKLGVAWMIAEETKG